MGFLAVRLAFDRWRRPDTPAAAATNAIATRPPIPALTVAPAIADSGPEPAPAPSAASESASLAVAPDPQAELSTAIEDLLSRLQEGSFSDTMLRYMPPSLRKSMSEERFEQMKKRAEVALQPGTPENEYLLYQIRSLASIRGTTPLMNNVADIATFEVSIPPPDGYQGKLPITIQFLLEDGRWYVR